MKFNPSLVSLAATICFSLLFSCTSNIEMPPLPEPIASSSSTGNVWDYSSSTGGISSSGGIGGSSSPSGQCSVSGFDGNEFIDPRDCKRYKYEIAFNGRVWMSENLNYSKNGTLGWCYKTRTDKNRLGAAGEDLPGCDSPYGRHYTYAIAMDGTNGQGLCPDGWVIPSVAEWGAVFRVSSGFYVKAGNFHPDVSDPLSSGEWKDRDRHGFYWVRNIPSGNSVGFIFFNGENSTIDARQPGASNAATMSDYFSIRCIMSQDYQPKCGGQPFNPATQKCVGGVVVNSSNSNNNNSSNSNNNSSSSSSSTPSSSSSGCTAADNTSTQYCSNGTMKTYGSTPEVGGRTYKTVVIGTQTWMAENLNYNASGSKCYAEGVTDVSVDSIAKNCAKYGRLYNWGTAKTVCPSGWHLPSDNEWTTLTNSVGGSSTAGTKLKAINGWNGGDNGTDDYGFSALPGGYGRADGYFSNVGYAGYWWSATEGIVSNAYRRYMDYSSADVYSDYFAKFSLYSVRCVQDKA